MGFLMFKGTKLQIEAHKKLAKRLEFIEKKRIRSIIITQPMCSICSTELKHPKVNLDCGKLICRDCYNGLKYFKRSKLLLEYAWEHLNNIIDNLD